MSDTIVIIAFAFVIVVVAVAVVHETQRRQQERIDMLERAIAKLVLRVSGERNWKDYI